MLVKYRDELPKPQKMNLFLPTKDESIPDEVKPDVTVSESESDQNVYEFENVDMSTL
jgi:hypothetical protein